MPIVPVRWTAAVIEARTVVGAETRMPVTKSMINTETALIKGGRALEQQASVDVLVFDKTGTLTTGEPRVTRVESFEDGTPETQVLALAAAAERRLTHPAAQASVEAAEQRGVPIPERDDGHVAVGLVARARPGRADRAGRRGRRRRQRFAGAGLRGRVDLVEGCQRHRA